MSTTAANLLRSLQADDKGIPQSRCLMPIQSISTRWNSILACVKRFLILKNYIIQAWSHVDLCKNNKKPEMLTNAECKVLSSILPLLEPLDELTKTFSSASNVTSSTAILAIVGLLEHKITAMQPDSEVAQTLKTQILKEIQNKKGIITSNLYLAAANILDPRLMRILIKILPFAFYLMKFMIF
jgi:hypothetical protein